MKWRLIANALNVAVACLCSVALPSEWDARAATVSTEALDKDTQLIVISGEIAATDSARFKNLAVQFEEAIVVLDSDGGALIPALEIGRTIRLRGYATVVMAGDTCASSCALIWLAGSPRFLAGEGRVGFHASYKNERGVLVETGIGNALVGHYLSQLNLPEKAVIFTTMAPPNEILWLNQDLRISSGIDFQPFPDAQPKSTARPSPAPNVIATPAPTSAPARIPGPSVTRGDAGEQEYLTGYDLWANKQYDAAERRLKGFLDNFPSHPRVTFARNVLGRILLDEGRPREAAPWFLQNYQANKRGERAPDSLLYLAETMRRLGDRSRTCIALTEFVEVYPREAAGRLKSMYDEVRVQVTCE